MYRDFMDAFLPWIEARTRHEVFRTMQASRVIAAPVLSVREALEDEQAQARGSYATVEQPVVGAMTSRVHRSVSAELAAGPGAHVRHRDWWGAYCDSPRRTRVRPKRTGGAIPCRGTR